MLKINITELFPTKWSMLIFIFYMALSINQGILVTASQKSNNSYEYNTVLAVLLTEIIKLCTSIIMYCYSHSLCSLFRQTLLHIKLLLMYLISSSLYCLYNNLSYINLAKYDPTTYFLLLQLRVVITGLIYQILFKKYLSSIQWLSLILLTVGCMLKEIKIGSIFDNNVLPIENSFVKQDFQSKETGAHLNFGLFLIFVQIFSSCFAGVYNEFLLKNKAEHVHLFLQNIFICFDSVICSITILLWQWDKDVFSSHSVQSVANLQVGIVILNNAAIGLTTSFFLKYLNSILKTFASALELVFIAVFCCIIFGVPVHLNTALAIIVVSFAIIIYSRNPVHSPSNIEISNKNSKEQPC